MPGGGGGAARRGRARGYPMSSGGAMGGVFHRLARSRDEGTLAISVFTSGAPPARIGDGESRGPAERSGEYRLILAILEDAVILYLKGASGSTVSANDVRGAGAWLRSRDRSSPFAFECICELLDFDSDSIRRGLRALRERPAEIAGLLAGRHPGRPVAAPVRSCTAGVVDLREIDANGAPAKCTSGVPLAG